MTTSAWARSPLDGNELGKITFNSKFLHIKLYSIHNNQYIVTRLTVFLLQVYPFSSTGDSLMLPVPVPMYFQDQSSHASAGERSRLLKVRQTACMNVITERLLLW